MKTSSRLLIEESPLVFQPSLATSYGLNEAILIQQVQFWISNPKIGEVRDERRWVRNSLEGWQEQFPFWSIETIKRTTRSLRESGVLLVRNDLNQHPSDRTGWYSIDYDALECGAKSTNGEVKSDRGSGQNRPLVDEVKLTPSLIRESTESLSQRIPLNPPVETSLKEPRPSRVLDDGSNLSHVAQQSIASQSPSAPQGQLPAAGPSPLARFVAAYPRKNATKAEIVAAWEGAKGKPPIEAMLFKLQEQKASHQWTEASGKFIPGIVKYLQTEGWNAPVFPPPEPKYKSQADWNSASSGKLVL